MRLQTKIIVPMLLVLVSIFAGAVLVLQRSMTKALLEEEFFRQRERILFESEEMLSREIIERAEAGDVEAHETLARFVQKLRSSSVGRVTLWARDDRVLHSDLASIIGERVPGHTGIKESFDRGESFFLFRSEDTDTPRQSNFGAFLNGFVPIIYDNTVFAVVETHAPVSVVLQAVRKSIFLAGSIFVVSGIALVIVLLMVIRFSVLRPLRQLRTVALSIGRGKLDEPLGDFSEDEIGELARDFSWMRSTLKVALMDLEQKREAAEASEKTAKDNLKDIQRFNELLVSRELRMKELKTENKELRARLGITDIEGNLSKPSQETI